MLGKLPQTFTAPFGLLSDEAKLAFRSQPGGIAKLASTRNISDTDSYWNQYFVLFDTPSDVYSLISPHDVRRAMLEAPENIATLIRVVTSRLFNLTSDHTFPTANGNSVTSYATSFIKAGSSERNPTKEVLNCLRVLQRVLPVVFELEGESNVFELEVLWKKVEVDDEGEPGVMTEQPQFVIEDDDDEEGSDNEGPKTSAPISQSKPKDKKFSPTLGEKLFSCIIDLLFCCGFTLPTKLQVDHYKINYVIWEKGVGSTTDVGSSQALDSNKTEVLRLLLVLLSRQIYVPPSSLFTKPSFYSLHFTRKVSRRDVLTILCSVLNTAMNSTNAGTATIGSMAGKLPYNHLVFKGEDPRSTFVGMCFQVLCAMLDFQSGPARDNVVGSGDNMSSTPTAQTNAFRYFLAKLHRTHDFAFILGGVIDVLKRQLAILNNLLPGARKPIPYAPEAIIFFWKMIELNKKFRAYVLDSDKAVDVLAYLLCYSLEIKDKPEQHGLCRALSYIVQMLSAEPAFGHKLSSPVTAQVPAKWNVSGTAADFMVTAIYSVVTTTSGSLNSIYPALIIALSNAAPYFKNLSIVASTKLIQLFTSFSNPLFLLSDEGHPRLLFFMLEVFNSVIFHHLSDNPNLIYAIVTAHKSFETLGTFTLSRGLREIRRVQLAKEEQAARKADNDGKTTRAKSGSISRDEDTEDAHVEKARLLRSENRNSPDLERGEALAEEPAHQSQSEARISQEESLITHSLPSPRSGMFPTGVSTSEKARGKMKARRSESLETTSSVERIAASGVGRNGFVPTQEWVTSWQQGLPLDVVMLVISELLPKVEKVQAGNQRATTAASIASFLQSVDLMHVLPPKPPVIPRRFLWSDASIVWLTSLIWGEIYVLGMSPLGVWNSTNVRLFYVKHAQTQQRQITETVSNVVGGLLSPVNRQGGERS